MTIRSAGEPFERRADQLIDLRRFSCETFPRIAPTREAADLQPDRLRFVALAKLDADTVLAVVVAGAVVLPARQPGRLVERLQPASDRGCFVRGPLEHHGGRRRV